MGVANKCFFTVHMNTVDATSNFFPPLLVKKCRLFELYVMSVKSCFVQTFYKLIEDHLMGVCAVYDAE